MTEGTNPEDLMPMDPRPDEDAWEAYIDFTLKLLGADGSNAVPNSTVTTLEAALGHPLPFELAILLLIGVPNGDDWHQWGDDPAAELADWQDTLANELSAVHGATVKDRLAAASPMIPIYRGFAMPVEQAEGDGSPDANPVFAIEQGRVRVAANDIAAWLHLVFDAPLPWWPDAPDKHVAVWTDLIG